MNYRQEILKILKLEKKSFFWIFILINIIPILEISLLYMIYLILEPTERESNVGNIASYFDIGGDNIYMIYVQEYSVQIMYVLAICLLAFEVATKFIQARILVNQAYSLFIRDAKRVLYSYLYSDYESVINIKNEKIMNNILYDSGSFPIIIKESVTILSSVILITIYTIASTKISLELSLAAVSIFVVSFAVNKKLFSTMKFTGQL